MPGKSEILLIQPPNVEGTLFNLPGTEIPLSLLYLAAYAGREGLPAALLDLTLEEDPFRAADETLAAGAPRVVGITSYTTNAAFASRLARRVKALSPGAFVVLGGFHASALPRSWPGACWAARRFPGSAGSVSGRTGGCGGTRRAS